MTMRILVSDDVSEKGVALLREHFDVDVKTNLPTEELLKIIGEYDGLVTRSQTQVTKDVIDAALNKQNFVIVRHTHQFAQKRLGFRVHGVVFRAAVAHFNNAHARALVV